jgi:hypothetical protein
VALAGAILIGTAAAKLLAPVGEMVESQFFDYYLRKL